MIETFVPTTPVPGAFVRVDPHLEALLAINLLDEEPQPISLPMEPPRFPHAEAASAERILVRSG